MPQAARRGRLEPGNWNLSPSGGAQASSAGMERGRASVAPLAGRSSVASVPAMLEAAEQGLGVTLAMAPLIKARPGFGKKLVAPFDIGTSPTETIYLVSRTEQARDRRIAALRRWIVDAVGRAR